jgi:hypothetical protein
MKSNTPHIGYNTVNSLNIVYLRHCIQSTWLLYISSTLNLILLYFRHCHTVNLVIIYIFDTRYSQYHRHCHTVNLVIIYIFDTRYSQYHRHCIQSTWLLYIFSTLQVSLYTFSSVVWCQLRFPRKTMFGSSLLPFGVHELLTLPEHPSSYPVFSGDRVTRF